MEDFTNPPEYQMRKKGKMKKIHIVYFKKQSISSLAVGDEL